MSVSRSFLVAMLMDDVVLPHNYVLAGVRIILGYQFVYLAIYGVKFNFETGKLDPNDTIWKESGHKGKQSDFFGVIMPHRKLPTEAAENFVDTEPDDIFMMGPAGGEDSPVAPFFDARPVEVRAMSLALSGLGVYHRGAAGYGGYFNLRLITIDLSDYVKY